MKILGRLVLQKVFVVDFVLRRWKVLTEHFFIQRHTCLLLLKLERINNPGDEVYLILYVEMLEVILRALSTEEGSDPLFGPEISQYQLEDSHKLSVFDSVTKGIPGFKECL